MPALRSPHLSIVAPVFNEKDSVPELYRRLQSALSALKFPWELILVDDGSTDGSAEVILDLSRRDRRVRPVLFARNFGHQIAVTAGLDHARGQAVVIIDADLQDPPELIPELI